MAIGSFFYSLHEPAELHEPMVTKPARSRQNGRGHLTI